MLSDDGCTYISRISADINIASTSNHNKPYYILIIMQQKLPNYTLHKAAYDGFCAETIQTTKRFDRERKWHRHCLRVSPKLHELLGEKFTNHFSNNADISITEIIEIQNLIP